MAATAVALIASTGNTQGIRFRIRPPRKANKAICHSGNAAGASAAGAGAAGVSSSANQRFCPPPSVIASRPADGPGA